MPVKISALPAGSAPEGPETIPAVQGGQTVSLTAAQLAALATAPSLQKAQNLSDLASAATAVSHLGFGAGATPGDVEINVANSDNGQSINDVMSAVGFGGNWFASQRFSTSYPSAHLDGRGTALFSRAVVGSSGDGAGNSDYPIINVAYKQGWETSTVDGEVDGQLIIVRQGSVGDCSGILINAGSVGISGGGVLAIESETDRFNSSGQKTFSMHSAPGFMEANNANGGYGQWTEARVGQCFSAFYSATFDDSAGQAGPSPSWLYHHYNAQVRGGPAYYSVAWNGSTKIGLNSTPIAGVLSQLSTITFSAIAAQNTQDMAVSVPGSAVGNSVLVSPTAVSGGLVASDKLVWTGYVSAPGTVTVFCQNISTSAITPGAQTLRITVLQF